MMYELGMNGRAKRAIAFAVAASTVCGCSETPTAPTPTTATNPPVLAAPLAAGAYTFSILATDTTSQGGTLVSACPGAGQAMVSSIYANAVIENDGAVSRGRPASAADGTFEIALRSEEGSSPTRILLSGSIRGVVVNTLLPGLPIPPGAIADARATFLGPDPTADARLTGTSMPPSGLAGGTVTDAVVVGTATVPVVTCAPGSAGC
jgi:hypothetical protein